MNYRYSYELIGTMHHRLSGVAVSYISVLEGVLIHMHAVTVIAE